MGIRGAVNRATLCRCIAWCCVLLSICVGFGQQGVTASSPAGESPVGDTVEPLIRSMEADPDDADAFAQLEVLLAHAPARQVGQPGNDLVDTFIRQLFERSVARNNDPKRRAEAVALERAEQAEAVLTRSLYDKQLAATRRTDMLDSPWYIQLTLESPSLLVLTLAMLAVMFWAGFAVQRRRALLVAGSVCVGAAIVALMVAALIDTEVERTAVESEGEIGGQIRTQQQVVEAANEAARAALRADLEAAEVLRGLWQCGRVRYPSVAFIPGQAVLTMPADPRARLGDRVRVHRGPDCAHHGGRQPEPRPGWDHHDRQR